MTADFPRAAAAHANHRGRAYPNCPYCHGHKDGAGSFPVPAMEAVFDPPTAEDVPADLEVVDVAEAAERLGLSRRRVQVLINRGTLAATRHGAGGYYRIRVEDLEAFAALERPAGRRPRRDTGANASS